MPSRVERNPELRGTKRRVAIDREVLVARGRADGRTVIFVPEVKGAQVTGITLLHVRFPDRLPVATIKGVLQGYRGRYDASPTGSLRPSRRSATTCSATSTLSTCSPSPIADLADRWRA